MSPKTDHPFCVDIRRSRSNADRFAWRILGRDGRSWRSSLSYATFEEARLAACGRLDELVAEWMRGRSGAS